MIEFDMSEFEFVIPLKRDDLQVSVEGQYFVSEVLYHDAIVEKLEECIDDLRNNGSRFILKHFDLLYSVLAEFNELDWNDIHKICDKIVLKSVAALSNFVEKAVDNGCKDLEDRIESLNIIKMTLYIYSQFFHCYMDKMALKTDTAVIVKGRKKKTLNEQHTEEYCWDWESKQKEGMIRVQTMLQCQMLSNLWDPPVVEETFVNMIADFCYRALEQPSINLVRSKYLKETIINILGILIKFYNHGLSFVVKSVQLLKRHEHCASLLAEAVLKYIDQGGCKSLIKRLLDEIHEASELLSSVTDNHCSKSFSNFLVQLAESNPHDFEPELDAIILFLDLEVAALRSLGLCVLTEVLLGSLSGDDASAEIKNKRIKCLDALADHMLDINAHVRAKVLQLWQKIVSQGALPKDWIIPLMEDTTDRLMDVSSIVTKQAVHLIRLMMETNPFAAMLSLDELTKTLEDETIEYEVLKKSKLTSFSSAGASKESLWAAVEPDLKDFLEQYFKEGSDLKAPPESPDIKRPHIQTISSFISERNFCKATNLLIYVENTYAGLKDLRKGVNTSDVDFYLDFFKRIFFDNQNSIPVNNKLASNDDSLGCNSSNVGVSDSVEDEINSALAAQKKRVSFYYDCIEFVKHLNVATDKIIALLSSKQAFDVIEAIEFIKLAKIFGVAGSDVGVIQMMKLINCPEEGIRTSASRAFEQLYLKTNENATSPADAAAQVVKNLCFLVKSMKLSQDDALNTLIKEWIKTSAINTYCIAAMISAFSAEQPGVTSDDCVAALILFSSVVQSKPEYVNKNLEDLIQKGLSRGRKQCKNKDLRIAHQVCVVLQHASSNHPSKRFSNDHIIFKEIYSSIIEHYLDFNEKNYVYFVESAIDLLFKLALGPDTMCVGLLLLLHKMTVKKNRSSTNQVSESSKESREYSSRVSEVSDQNDSTCQQKCDKREMCIQQEALTRFIFIIGHIAVRACLYLEQDVLEERKRRARLELKEVPQPSSKKKTAKEDNEEDDELNMAVDVAAANDDALSEEVRHICENEILYGSGVIAKYEYLPATVLQNEGRYSDPRLKSVASVTLGQFMLISNKYCRQYVQLFVTILEKTCDLVVKKNLVILFGELLFRHPNVIEPWITYLYSRLRDPCRDVRLNTLLVISHLITNEMVKVKAQISDVALCIVDSDEEIKETATRLFHELSLKGNTLYNVLPDIISTLSNPEALDPLSEENFQKILRYLIELIQKEKQMELLVEKLCVRLRTSETERQWSDLCFCLSLFSYSERSIRRLMDYYASSFASKLYCPAVYNCLTSIIGSANKSSKPAVKEAAAELSAMLEESNKVGENNDCDEGNENGDKTKSLGDENVNFSARKPSRFKTPRTVRKGTRGSSVKKSTRSTTGRKKYARDDSSSNDDSENELVSAPSSRPVRSTKRRLVIEEEEEDSDCD